MTYDADYAAFLVAWEVRRDPTGNASAATAARATSAAIRADRARTTAVLEASLAKRTFSEFLDWACESDAGGDLTTEARWLRKTPALHVLRNEPISEGERCLGRKRAHQVLGQVVDTMLIAQPPAPAALTVGWFLHRQAGRSRQLALADALDRARGHRTTTPWAGFPFTPAPPDPRTGA